MCILHVIFDTKFPATDLSIGYVLRYYFYTGIDLSSTNNVLLSMNNNSFSMPETRDPIELVRAVIYEIRDMAYGSKEYEDFQETIDYVNSKVLFSYRSSFT